MRERPRGGTYRRLVAAAGGVLLLAACGTEDPDAVAVATAEEEVDTEEAEEPEEPTAEPEEELGGQDTAEEDEETGPAAGSVEDGTDDGDSSQAEPALGACDLAADEGGQQLDADTYEQLTLEANFELELLVADMAADLDELLSGVSDGPTLEGQLADHRAAYAAAVEPLRDVAPPDGAAEWHERAMGTFDDVCSAIEDGLAGSAEGDEARFDAFVAEVTEFPGLINGLHANAACGPLETC